MGVYDNIIGSMVMYELMRDAGKFKGKPVKHRQTCPDCGRKLINLYKIDDKTWVCGSCKERVIEHISSLPKPKLIKTWGELAECTSETHCLRIDDGCGWIYPRNRTDGNGLEGRHYLSTHTFYGGQNEHSTKLLQSCGFNVEIANWDELGW